MCLDSNKLDFGQPQLGVEQNRNRNFEQKPKLVPARSRYRKYRHTGHNFQEESRKNIFFLYIYSKSERWKWKRKNILPAFFLKVVAGMPVFPVSWSSRNQFWLLLKVSVSVSVQPLSIVLWAEAGQSQAPRLVVYYMDHPPCWALIWHNDDDDDDDNDDHDDHDDQYDDDDHDDDEPSNQTKIKSLKVIHVSSHQKKLLFRFSTNIEAAILHVY